MSSAQRWLLGLSVLGTAASGTLYGWMLYLLENEDPFVAFNHPWQPWLGSAHLLLAPLLVFAVGWIFSDHVLAGWRLAERRRTSGLLLSLLLAPLVFSGYGLLVSAAHEVLRTALAWIHGVGALFWTVLFAAHILTRLRRWARRSTHSV